MFDIGGLELLVIAAIALIVVGPKELPGMVRNVGRWVSRARQLARDFQQGMEDAAKEADVEELSKIGSIKSDLERQARDFGRSVMEDVDPDRPARRTPRAPERPEPSPEPREHRAEPRQERAPRAPRPRPAPAEEPRESDDALERFQRGMRRTD